MQILHLLKENSWRTESGSFWFCWLIVEYNHRYRPEIQNPSNMLFPGIEQGYSGFACARNKWFVGAFVICFYSDLRMKLNLGKKPHHAWNYHPSLHCGRNLFCAWFFVCAVDEDLNTHNFSSIDDSDTSQRCFRRSISVVLQAYPHLFNTILENICETGYTYLRGNLKCRTMHMQKSVPTTVSQDCRSILCLLLIILICVGNWIWIKKKLWGVFILVPNLLMRTVLKYH